MNLSNEATDKVAVSVSSQSADRVWMELAVEAMPVERACSQAKDPSRYLQEPVYEADEALEIIFPHCSWRPNMEVNQQAVGFKVYHRGPPGEAM